MRYVVAVCLTFVLAVGAQAQTLPKGQRLGALTGGRFANDLDSVAHTGQLFQKFAWSGVYFETRFKGSSISFWLDDPNNNFALVIDGETVETIHHPKERSYTYDKLKKGEHLVRLEKISESQAGYGRWGGFYSQGKSLPYQRRDRQIEFVGDSWTVGYGNISPSRDCTQEQLVERTNTSLAFGPLTAKQVNADYQVNAFSGRGVVRNYDGIAPGEPLPALYPYALFDGATVSAGASWWAPQLLVVGLGGNDFSTPVKPGEKWPSDAALAADFEASYVLFLKELRRRNPNAFLLVMNYDGPKVAPHVDAVIAAMKASGETRIDSLTVGDFALTGCHWHLDLNDHRRISAQLTQWIDTHPDLWSSK